MKSLRPVPSQGKVEQAKKTWRLQTPPRKRLKTPESEVTEDLLMKDKLNNAVNYLQKGCFNSLKHQIFTHALPLRSLSRHAKLQAARYHGFGVMEETLTD